MTVISPARRAQLMQQAAALAVLVALGLVGLKFWAWQQSGALSLLSALIDSVLDMGLSAVNFFVIRAALMPADAEHRFGHGKAEALAALAQAFFILLTSVYLVYEAVHRLFYPHPLSQLEWAVASMVVALAATQGLVWFQSYVVKQTGSLAVMADRVHYQADSLINGSVLVAMLAIILGAPDWLDGALAGVLAVYLVWCSRGILAQALDVLLDRELPDAVRQQIEAIIRADPDFIDFHDLRTRIAGPHYFIQFHLELPGDLPLDDAHRIADRIEHAIIAALPNAQVSIHQEPAGIIDRRDNFV
jgi:ferrous-iron efflux pump FieF